MAQEQLQAGNELAEKKQVDAIRKLRAIREYEKRKTEFEDGKIWLEAEK
jgi:ClpP class serine protease